ncbi:MAG TPA: cytochrome c [Pyrinomonadaceae bacterium]|nr:cytochrome c [Pyrinomonadaceae bacterium]
MKQRFKPLIMSVVVLGISAAVLMIGVARSSNVIASPATAFDAASVYNGKCAGCHGRDGRASSLHSRHEHARDLTSAEWQDGVSDERIYNSISNGKGKMPGFNKKLSDSQIDELVKYVRRLRK